MVDPLEEGFRELTPVEEASIVRTAVDIAAQGYHKMYYLSFPVRDQSGKLFSEFMDADAEKHQELNFWGYHHRLRERCPWVNFPYPLWQTMVGRRMSDIRNREREEALQRDREEMRAHG